MFPSTWNSGYLGSSTKISKFLSWTRLLGRGLHHLVGSASIFVGHAVFEVVYKVQVRIFALSSTCLWIRRNKTCMCPRISASLWSPSTCEGTHLFWKEIAWGLQMGDPWLLIVPLRKTQRSGAMMRSTWLRTWQWNMLLCLPNPVRLAMLYEQDGGLPRG